MSQILPSFVVIAGLLAAAPASALPTQNVFLVTIGGSPAGGLIFALDQEVAGACRYSLEWTQIPRVPSEQCFVDEQTAAGAAGCFQASTKPIATVVTLPPPGVPCQGIDESGQSAPVYALVASERATDGGLQGVIQLDDASSTFYPFEAVPAL
jgi:hypothetical protein